MPRRNATFATALRVITRLASVTYRKEGDVYGIGLRPPPAVDPTTEEAAGPERAQTSAKEAREKALVQFEHAAIFTGLALGSALDGGKAPPSKARRPVPSVPSWTATPCGSSLTAGAMAVK